MTIGPVVEGLTALLAHRVTAASDKRLGCSQPHLQEREAWRLPDELFLVSLLGGACGDQDRRNRLKRSFFEVFRLNETDAASFLQRWWRGVAASRFVKEKIKLSAPGQTPQKPTSLPTGTPIIADPSTPSTAPIAPASELASWLAAQTMAANPSLPSTALVASATDSSQTSVAQTTPSPPVSKMVRESPASPSASAALIGALGRRAAKAPRLPSSPSCKPSQSHCVADSGAVSPSMSHQTAAVASPLERPAPQKPSVSPSCSLDVSKKPILGPTSSPSAASTSAATESPQGLALPAGNDSAANHAAVHSSRPPSTHAKPRPPPILTGDNMDIETETAPATGKVAAASTRSQTAHNMDIQVETAPAAGAVPAASTRGQAAHNMEIEAETAPATGTVAAVSASTRLQTAHNMDIEVETAPATRTVAAASTRGQTAHNIDIGFETAPAARKVAAASTKGQTAHNMDIGTENVPATGKVAAASSKAQTTTAKPLQRAEPKIAVNTADSTAKAVEDNRHSVPAQLHSSDGTPPVPAQCHGNGGGTATPSSSGGGRSGTNSPAAKEDSRCQGVRGDNPFRRKWNPRLAAARRREIEASQKQEAKEAEVGTQRHSLGDCLNAEADAAAEAEAVAAQAEAAQAEAEAAALAELAAKENLTDQRFTRQQDSVDAVASVFHVPGAATTNSRRKKRVGVESSDDYDHAHATVEVDLGTARSGLSLSAPKDRGPTHTPGARETQSSPSKDFDAERLPTPRSQPAALQPGAPRSQRPKTTQSASPRTHRTFSFGGSPVISDAVDVAYTEAAGNLDFGQIQQLISKGIANGETDEDVDLGRETVAAVPRQTQSQDQRHASKAAMSRQVAREASETASTTGGEAPRRAIADIRAAAERRAYNRHNAETEQHQEHSNLDAACASVNEGIDGALSTATESRRNMSAIRAIAERRASGLRSSTPRSTTPRSTTPRSTTPPCTNPAQSNAMTVDAGCLADDAAPPLQARAAHEADALRCGGAYKPSRVYSGRAGNGSGLSDALGLKFGQRPPAR